ncbi:HXXEE domain-containing protein [Dinghuibacter silviterrae]|uniref:Uncharacterized protein with HXXEE motif n=1 Tax=Dinghuibacter silviterrae TaxID=1539049 RepID=A0A4R8DGZ0_9BACT|nr:HXXEE domain-containing protein [Dinghuibacter silviterrae]TDW96658.1 uncharacterized protein with HXXEE motif [Dinghuibacter silviterrae]
MNRTDVSNNRFNLAWLYDNWNKSTIFLAVFVSAMLTLYVKNNNYALFLLWLQTPVCFLQQFEEYILPGGFAGFFNKKVLGSDKSDFPFTKARSFWVNIALIFIAFPVSAILSGQFALSIGLWTAYFSVINSLPRVVMALKFKGYNPGLIVSVLFKIPLGVYVIYYFASNHIVSTKAQLTGLAIGLLCQVLLGLWGGKILKPLIKKENRL